MSNVIKIETIGDLEKCIKSFPAEWPLKFSTKGGGYIVAEHRQTSSGQDFVAIYNDNGGRFGQNPLTEEEYKKTISGFFRKKTRSILCIYINSWRSSHVSP